MISQGGTAMLKQKDMENVMLKTHREFINGMAEGLSMLEKDVEEAGQMEAECSEEWCQAIEDYIDELHKFIYSISEPRWATADDSHRIKNLRKRIKKLYTKFEKVSS
jgi:archaellum component FlaC